MIHLDTCYLFVFIQHLYIFLVSTYILVFTHFLVLYILVKKVLVCAEWPLYLDKRHCGLMHLPFLNVSIVSKSISSSLHFFKHVSGPKEENGDQVS